MVIYICWTNKDKNVHKIAVQQKEVDVVRLEEGMVLSCLCPWDGKLTMVSWTKVPDNNPMAVLHPDLGESFSHLYQDRLEFLRLSQMDGSISLRNVTHQDIGEYHCSIQTFPRGPWTRNIQVEDLEVTVADTVLVAEQSNNMTIRCNHQPNSTVYQVIFERMMLGHHWAIIGVCKTVEGGLVGEDYSDRGRVDCADSLDVTLHLTDVVPEDSGFYRCTFNTDVGVQTTTIHNNKFCAYCIFLFDIDRKKNKRKEYRVKLHPSQRQVDVALFILSTLVFTLDTFKALPHLLMRHALSYKPVTLYN
uniref:CD226 molecule n=1 Tax=Kryptolebias marmoratus TaxID=37003 RepID=A0A3Q2ZXX5_KRYMA